MAVWVVCGKGEYNGFSPGSAKETSGLTYAKSQENIMKVLEQLDRFVRSGT